MSKQTRMEMRRLSLALQTMHRRPGPLWLDHPTNILRQNSPFDLASNTALDLQYPVSITGAATQNDNHTDAEEPRKGLVYPQGIKLAGTASDVHTRAKRTLRVLSHHRLYHDHTPPHSPSTPPVLSPASKSTPTPPFFLYAAVPPSEGKSRTRGQSLFWRHLLYALCHSPSFWLVVYFFFNLSLTLYNKYVLIEFPFPYTLTAMHALCSSVGSSVLLRLDGISFSGMRRASWSLNWQEITALVTFSVLFTANIAVSNISLDLVTVPFHQVVRATTPLFTILFSRMLLGSHSSRSKIISLAPVIVGVALATYGDYNSTLWGFLLTLLGTLLAALKTIVTNVLQTSPSQSFTHNRTSAVPLLQFLQPRPTLSTLSPLQYLYFLSPLAFVQSLILAQLSGEFKAMSHHMLYHLHPKQHAFLIINGLLAFGLNIASFGANKRVGAITMSVAANIKQVLTVLCAVMIFDLRISLTNAIGIALTLGGGAWYTAIETEERKRNRNAMPDALTVELGGKL